MKNMPDHGRMSSCLETAEGWQQEEHPAIEYLPQQIPSVPYKHRMAESEWGMTENEKSNGAIYIGS